MKKLKRKKKYIYISPETRQKINDDLRLMEDSYNINNNNNNNNNTE